MPRTNIIVLKVLHHFSIFNPATGGLLGLVSFGGSDACCLNAHLCSFYIFPEIQLEVLEEFFFLQS